MPLQIKAILELVTTKLTFSWFSDFDVFVDCHVSLQIGLFPCFIFTLVTMMILIHWNNFWFLICCWHEPSTRVLDSHRSMTLFSMFCQCVILSEALVTVLTSILCMRLHMSFQISFSKESFVTEKAQNIFFLSFVPFQVLPHVCCCLCRQCC